MPIRLLALVALTAVLPACASLSGTADSGVTGTYAGTLVTPEFSLPMTLTTAEGAGGQVRGTAELRRGDIVIYYQVEGMRAESELTLTLDTEADDLAIRATVSENGRRLAGTATGGDLRDAALVLTR